VFEISFVARGTLATEVFHFEPRLRSPHPTREKEYLWGNGFWRSNIIIHISEREKGLKKQSRDLNGDGEEGQGEKNGVWGRHK